MIGVDPKCVELAEHFLGREEDTPDDRDELAENIQAAVEDFLFARKVRAVIEEARKP